MDKEEYLSRAKNHLFMTGINDNGMKLCTANMVYGIAKIHFLQEKLGVIRPENKAYLSKR